MKCPYTCGKIEQVNQNAYDYNDDNLTTFHEHILTETRVMPDCLKADCAAWYEGRCRYNDGRQSE